jgi:hypothetical protein
LVIPPAGFAQLTATFVDIASIQNCDAIVFMTNDVPGKVMGSGAVTVAVMLRDAITAVGT